MESETQSKNGEWRLTKLGDLGEVARGRSRHRPRYAEHLYNGPYPFIQTGDVKASQGRINSHKQTYSEAGLAQSRLWPEKTMCITIAANIAETGILKYPACFPDSIIGFIADEKKCDVFFVEYMFRHLRQKIQHEATGSVQDNINLQTLDRLEFLLPPLHEQKAIAHVLGSLDDRIELNRRMNETLEAMAQALFKSWFVDFDPVIDNALASGKEVPEELAGRAAVRAALGDKRKPLPAEIRALFPDEFVYSDEMGWIPKGWEVKPINEILTSVSEPYPLRKVDKVVFLNTGDILDGQFLHNNYSETRTLPGQAKKSIKKNDILYSEIRPQNRRFAYVHFDAPEYVISTKLMVLRAVSNIKSIFAYYILKQQSNIDYLQMMAESRSGTFPQITFDVLATINVTIPCRHEIIQYFSENILEQFLRKSIANSNNSKNISNLRDTLLPKLLSGELRIPKGEV